jgi:hypothetical protein
MIKATIEMKNGDTDEVISIQRILVVGTLQDRIVLDDGFSEEEDTPEYPLKDVKEISFIEIPDSII